ncbi:MAG: SAM-dependent methyltransferase [Chryseobacterium sp.]|nr:MAG: SAM-dependent methyltransferase [Chryseobacterium sp.]
MSKTESIELKFNAVSEKYDKQRKELIPCFDDFYSIPAALATRLDSVTTVLDVGAGTGLLSAFFFEKYPNAHFSLVDISEGMLNKAKERFAGYNRFEFLVQDFSAMDLEDNSFDLVVSGLAIHHLDDVQKKNLYKTIYKLLKTNGMFINADQVLGENNFAEELYTKTWKNQVLKNPNLTEQEKESTFERIKLDKMSPLSEQLNWLAGAGFRNVANVYQYYNFVVFTAQK